MGGGASASEWYAQGAQGDQTMQTRVASRQYTLASPSTGRKAASLWREEVCRVDVAIRVTRSVCIVKHDDAY
jgi:hypothetical protein